ncbi:MAG: hypothetical protein K8I27_01405 [Planctomycetes bacterium]|nr:hypothetical protein [Planctomycetota bacterium]
MKTLDITYTALAQRLWSDAVVTCEVYVDEVVFVLRREGLDADEDDAIVLGEDAEAALPLLGVNLDGERDNSDPASPAA